MWRVVFGNTSDFACLLQTLQAGRGGGGGGGGLPVQCTQENHIHVYAPLISHLILNGAWRKGAWQILHPHERILAGI